MNSTEDSAACMTTSQTRNRIPLDHAFLEKQLTVHGGLGPFSTIYHSDSTGSTNTDLVAAARAGAPAWSVHITEHQQAGRGRMGRKFQAPPSALLAFSVLIRPPQSALNRLGTLSLAAGLALVDVLESHEGIGLKWPNDLVCNTKKLSGILAEAVDLGDNPAIVIGVGLNVDLREDELPVAHASSLYLEGIQCDRTELAVHVLRSFYRRIRQWEDNAPELIDDYRKVCVTLGQEVRAILPGEKELLGRAVAVTDQGHLLIEDQAGVTHEMSVGDIIHLRQKDQWHYCSDPADSSETSRS
ncbi:MULTISPECIES: biotin--[acetyl-CoA-carboxylase] ligase [unclassified Corynebacterium]|uniref:biotin--[acetyl-CoA-carboxylase] ligase n=1 Tax=unclassified Corynebacterium TaxID=2624378 RepID=UPI001FF00685|nr:MULTISPECIES: biotin--[acetyl-CoA-carboxylase] ligase [unclassified Corynebacterium]